MTLWLIHIFKRRMINRVWAAFSELVESKKFMMRQLIASLFCKKRFKDILRRKGWDISERYRRDVRSSLTIFTNCVRDRQEAKAREVMLSFLQDFCGKVRLMFAVNALPGYITKYRTLAIETWKMRQRRRQFLSHIFKREYSIMLDYFRAKKKPQSKRTAQKLLNMKPHNLEKIIEDFFYQVCYNFYKRQNMLHVLMRRKYLKINSALANEIRLS